MRNKFLTGLLLIVSVSLGIGIKILYEHNTNLEQQLDLRDHIIQNSAKNDSVIVEKTKDYANSIKQFNNEITFNRDGKTLTSAEVVKVFNELLRENTNLSIDKIDLLDSIRRCNREREKHQKILESEHRKNQQKYLDSISNLNWKLDVIKKNYGIDYQLKRTAPNMMRLEKQTTMIDSAIILFPYYKHTLTKEGDTWFIETDREYRKSQKNKQKNTVEKSK